MTEELHIHRTENSQNSSMAFERSQSGAEGAKIIYTLTPVPVPIPNDFSDTSGRKTLDGIVEYKILPVDKDESGEKSEREHYLIRREVHLTSRRMISNWEISREEDLEGKYGADFVAYKYAKLEAETTSLHTGMNILDWAEGHFLENGLVQG
jgi:hypothetical protein